ncbi:MAG: hypothetical protein ACLUD0_09875 [Eubacterium ramulus]
MSAWTFVPAHQAKMSPVTGILHIFRFRMRIIMEKAGLESEVRPAERDFESAIG